ncbi:MAG: hypothetical protein AAF927_09760 [Bacteroidota bacterium]
MKTTQRLLLMCFTLLLVGTACKGSKTVAWSAVGNWDFTVTGTPAGEVAGVMVITQSGDDYKGELRTEEGTLELEDVKLVDNKLTANLSYQGYSLNLEGMFNGDMMDGEVSMGYDSFTIKATRQ